MNQEAGDDSGTEHVEKLRRLEGERVSRGVESILSLYAERFSVEL